MHNRSLFFNPADPRCPITSELFFNAVSADCGHVFENEAIIEWKTHSSTCPSCRKPIGELKRVLEVETIVDSLLENNHALAEEIHYSVNLLKQVMNNGSTAEIKRLIRFFSQQSERLNETLYTLASHQNGIIILQDKTIQEKIEAKAFNHPAQHEQSPASLLAKKTENRKLLLETSLRNKLDPQILASIEKAIAEEKRHREAVLVNLNAKFILKNGKLVINPEYLAARKKTGQHSSISYPEKALAIISTPDEMFLASEILEREKGGQPIQMADSMPASIEIMQDPEFLSKFKTLHPLDGGDLLEQLCSVFSRYEIPIGMINKLLRLTEYHLNFIIDDSGSMNEPSDLMFKDATAYMRKSHRDPQSKLTRWEAVEDRLHMLVDLIGYIPTNGITLNYLNELDSHGRKNPSLVLNQSGKNPKDFIAEAHAQISLFFYRSPNQATPLFGALNKAFREIEDNTLHYVFSDGIPSDCTADEFANLISRRNHPQKAPLTIINLNDDGDMDWMREVATPYFSVVDDYQVELKETLLNHGPVFPYTKGIWLINHLLKAICPHDLDAFNEIRPFTKYTLENLLGRKLSLQEYQDYFQNNPNAKEFASHFSTFANKNVEAHSIIQNPLKVSDQKEAERYGYDAPPSYDEAVYEAQPMLSKPSLAPAYSPALFSSQQLERKAMQAEGKQVVAEAKPVKKTKYERIKAFLKF